MPKIIDYGSRNDCIREAAFTITLREGCASLTIPKVAAELNTSVSTVRRTIASSDHLPVMAYRWLNTRARQRTARQAPGEIGAESDWARALDSLLRTLPYDPSRADDARVAQAVLIHDQHQGWAMTEEVARAEYLQSRSATVYADLDLSTDAAAFETTRLYAVILGTLSAVCARELPPADSIAIVRDHALAVRAACHLGSQTGVA